MGSMQNFTLIIYVTMTQYPNSGIWFQDNWCGTLYAIHDLVKQSKSFCDTFLCGCVSKFQDKTSKTKTKTKTSTVKTKTVQDTNHQDQGQDRENCLKTVLRQDSSLYLKTKHYWKY